MLVKRVLEIGIDKPQAQTTSSNRPRFHAGDALGGWRTFFPNAQIHGVGLTSVDTGKGNLDNYHVYRVDPTCPMEMAHVITCIDGPLDFIVDNGSNVETDQTKSFMYLEGKLAHNGIYMIDNIQPESIWRWKKLKVFSNQTYIDYLERKYFITYFDRRLVSLREDDFCMVFLRKKNNVEK